MSLAKLSAIRFGQVERGEYPKEPTVLENFTQLDADAQHRVETFGALDSAAHYAGYGGSRLKEWFEAQERAAAGQSPPQPIPNMNHARPAPRWPTRSAEELAVEFDPNGLDAHQPGAKLDGAKTRPGLVLGAFARALLAVSDVGTYGARKYSDDGWLMVADGQRRYSDALWRHLLAEAGGEACDPESGLAHAAHAAWNALARLELMLREAGD